MTKNMSTQYCLHQPFCGRRSLHIVALRTSTDIEDLKMSLVGDRVLYIPPGSAYCTNAKRRGSMHRG